MDKQRKNQLIEEMNHFVNHCMDTVFQKYVSDLQITKTELEVLRREEDTYKLPKFAKDCIDQHLDLDEDSDDDFGYFLK